MTVHVSVVVPTYRRPALLKRCLVALMAQNFDPAAYEVIVVDDAGDEETRHLVDSWAARGSSNGHRPQDKAAGLSSAPGPVVLALALSPDEEGLGTPVITPGPSPAQEEGESLPLPAGERVGVRGGEAPLATANGAMPPSAAQRALPPVRYIPMVDAHGPAAARNTGWRAARGEIIAFTDDDCIPDPDWLRAGSAAFDGGVVGVAGRIVVPLSGTPTDYERNAACLESGDFVTANCFYRRDVLAAVGGFDERFKAAWREDSDLLFTVLERVAHDEAAGLIRAPEALVVHPVRPAPWGISLHQQRKSMFNALLYRKHPALYRERLQPVTPWHYYAIVVALLGILAAVLAGHTGLAVALGGAWLFLTIRFWLRRLRDTSRAPGHVFEMAVTSALIPPLSVFWRLAGAIKYRVVFF